MYNAEESRFGGDPLEDLQLGLVEGESFDAVTHISLRDNEETRPAGFLEHVHESTARGGAGEGEGTHSPPPAIKNVLYTDSFRAVNGTQVAGNAYTIGAKFSNLGDDSDIWAEVGLRAEDARVRCILNYRGQGGTSSIHQVYIARERLGYLPVKDAHDEGLLYGAAGKGLYDPPPQSRSNLYFSVYAQGGLTIRFPLKVEDGHPGVISVDWSAGPMRYQADRTFDALDGTCRTLEVTEIGTEDAEVYLPDERF
ncbi:unnamed protein product [Discosporangium mesarthrocarpum]